MGEKSDALNFANNSLKNGTEHPLAYLVKSKCLLNQKKPTEAAPLLESALAHDPYQQWPDISIALSQTYCQTGSYRKGLFVLNKLDPAHRNTPAYLAQAGDCHLMLNDLDSARFFYESALLSTPEQLQSLMGMACVELERNDRDKALRYLEKAFRTKAITEDEVRDNKRLKTLANDKRFKILVKQYL